MIAAPNVKGSALAARIAWVERHHGDAGLRRLRAALAPQTAALLDGNLLKSSWYPFASFIDLNLTIDRLWGKGDLALVKALGRFGADVNLKTIYRLFYLVGSVQWIMERAAALWSVNYDSGRLLVERRGADSATLSIADFATPHRAHCLAVFGWAERSIELSGGALVESFEPSCRARGDAECRFSFTWR